MDEDNNNEKKKKKKRKQKGRRKVIRVYIICKSSCRGDMGNSVVWPGRSGRRRFDRQDSN